MVDRTVLRMRKTASDERTENEVTRRTVFPVFHPLVVSLALGLTGITLILSVGEGKASPSLLGMLWGLPIGVTFSLPWLYLLRAGAPA